jgi:hypothetical protein
MRRQLLVPVLVLAAVFAGTYVAALAMGGSVSLAVIATVVIGFFWLVGKDVRRKPWPSDASQRAQDAAYAAAMIAAMHMPAQSGADCPTSFDGGFGGGADCGAGGI